MHLHYQLAAKDPHNRKVRQVAPERLGVHRGVDMYDVRSIVNQADQQLPRGEKKTQEFRASRLAASFASDLKIEKLEGIGQVRGEQQIQVGAHAADRP
jgi:hypothetical protein